MAVGWRGRAEFWHFGDRFLYFVVLAQHHEFEPSAGVLLPAVEFRTQPRLLLLLDARIDRGEQEVAVGHVFLLLLHFAHADGEFAHLVIDEHLNFEQTVAEGNPVAHIFGNDLVEILVEAADVLKQDFELMREVVIGEPG